MTLSWAICFNNGKVCSQRSEAIVVGLQASSRCIWAGKSASELFSAWAGEVRGLRISEGQVREGTALPSISIHGALRTGLCASITYICYRQRPRHQGQVLGRGAGSGTQPVSLWGACVLYLDRAQGHHHNCYHLSSAYYSPGTILSFMSTNSLTLHDKPVRQYYYHPHFTDQEAGALRGK